MPDETLLYLDDVFIKHDPGAGHAESPARLVALRTSLRDDPVPGTRWAEGRPATREEIERVHAAVYIDAIEAVRGQTAQLDPDTMTSPDSVEAAVLAAGSACAAVDAVFAGEARRAFLMPRPPGHHAENDRAMGFCLFNNVAIAAAHALATHDCRRVLVLDWDVHHGNGTQHTFEHRDDVLVFNSHQYPLYPGTGRIEEVGHWAGRGFTVNVSLPPGCGDAEYVAAHEQLFLPIADQYKPDLVLVSAGFDAHRDDPLASMLMTEEGFAALAAMALEIADRHAGGKLVLCLEGGYNLRALPACVRTVLGVLGGDDPPTFSGEPSLAARTVIEAVKTVHAPFWSI